MAKFGKYSATTFLLMINMGSRAKVIKIVVAHLKIK